MRIVGLGMSFPRNTLSLIVAMLVFAIGCSPEPGTSRGTEQDPTSTSAPGGKPVGLLTDTEILVDGEQRLYDVYVPATHWEDDTPAPVVVLLHGQRGSRDGLTGESERAAPFSRWQAQADANNILLLVPAGTEGGNGHAGWNDCRTDVVGNPETDDVSFIVGALEQMGDTYHVDLEEVFAVGVSNGGHMAIRLAQESPRPLSGIGVIAAGMPVNSGCAESDHAVSAVFMFGTDDPIAPYEGGAMVAGRGQILSADASIQYWVDRNQTATPPITTAFDDIDSDDGSTVERLLYTEGVDGTQVSLYRIVGGGHTSPSVSEQYSRLYERAVGRQNHDIEMAAEIWDFFEGGR